MSLITRCPACETLFKVVPDQLKISEGWVRCGHCDEIFDASLHLLPVIQETTLPLIDAVQIVNNLDNSGVLAEPEAAHTVAGIESVLLTLEQTGSTPLVYQDVQDELSPSVPVMDLLPVDEVVVDRDEPDRASPDEPADVSFLHDKRKESFWRKPLMRATLFILCLALLLGLSAQVVFHERDRLASMEAGLKPFLLAFCRPLNCTLTPLQRIESIAIDSSSFTKIQGDSYRLAFTVKNMAATELAKPAIELTLTDLLDQPVVRRVLNASEVGSAGNILAAGAEWSTSVVIEAKSTDSAERVTGYRLLAFYP